MGIFNNQKDDEGGPVMARPGSSFKKTSSPFGRSPAFSKAAGSIRDRLKNLSKKDIAFVSMGLSILVAAPVAEHMISAPPSQSELSAGFGDRRKGALDGSLYEPGINSLSQGSPDGSGEVITPLSSRDPASLIIGSPSSQPPAPPSAPPSDVRDAPRDVVRNAAAEAIKKAGVPTVIPKMQTALRGMGSLGGEGTRTTGGSLGGGQILASAKSASGKAATRSMVGPVGGPGYGGVASSQNSANKGAFETLRGQADRSASNFSGGGGFGSLERAAAESMSVPGGPGGMTGADGEKFGRPGLSSTKDHRQMGGESLAQMAARMRMQKALEWEFFLKYDIPKQIINALVTGMSSSLQEMAKKATDGLTGQTSPPGEDQFCGMRDEVTGKCFKINLKLCGKDKPIASCKCNCDPASAGGVEPGGPGPGPVPNPSPSPSPDASGPGGGNAPNPQLVSQSGIFEGYDNTLKDMYGYIRDGESASGDPQKQLEAALPLAGAFENLRADSAAGQIKAGADKTRQEAVGKLDQAIEDADDNHAVVQEEFNKSLSWAEVECRKAQAGESKTAAKTFDGISVVAQDKQEIAPTICNNVKAVRADGAEGFPAAESRLEYLKQASEVYKTQLFKVKDRVDAVSQEYLGTVLPGAKAIKQELESISSRGVSSQKDTDDIKKYFEELSGQNYFKKALAWRGASDSYAGGEVDGGQTLSAEQAAWASVDPLAKYYDGMAALSNEDNLAQGNLLAALYRSYPKAGEQSGEIYKSATDLAANAPMTDSVLDVKRANTSLDAVSSRMKGMYGLSQK